jgi:hypothetical protein
VSAQPNKLRWLHWLGMRVPCAAMVGIAWTVAGVGVFINAKNGQRLSIDVDGSNLNWWLILAISVAPVAAMSWSGLMSRNGRRAASVGWFFLALVFVTINIWMAGEYLGDQMLGRAEQAKDQKSSNRKIADMTNEEILRSKRDAEDKLLKAITTTKDPAEKKRLEEQLEHLQTRPLALIAPSFAGPSVGARASWLSKLLGWSMETVEGITPNVVPVVMAAVELFFSLAGFSQWPKAQNENPSLSNLIKPKYQREDAKADVLAIVSTGGVVPSGAEAARRWNVSPQTAGNWLRDFRKEGLLKRERQGVRLAIVKA